VILNKTDLVDAGHLAATEEWLCNTCPDAVVIQAQDAAVDPMLLLGVTDQPGTRTPAHIHAHEIFTTWDWAHDGGPVDRPLIEVMMADLGDHVVRAKGIVWLDEEPDHQMILQRVGKRWTLRRGNPWVDGVDRGSQLVFIGVSDT